MTCEIKQILSEITPPDEAARAAALRRWDACAKPLGSLGLLEEAVARVAALTGDANVVLDKRTLLVLCADNGVTAQGVTQSPSSVTAAVLRSMAAGRSPVCAMARVAGCEVTVVDVGVQNSQPVPGVLSRRVRNGTDDIALGPAMTRQEAERAILTGVSLVREQKRCGVRLLATGEMGIGNTTTATAVACALLGRPPAALTGRGAGLSDAGLVRKVAVIEQALSRNAPNPADPLDVISRVGGLDLAALCGVFLGGAQERVPVLIDGLIGAVAALCAVRLCPDVKKAMLASHVSAEPAGAEVLAALGLSPLITAGMRLGEGTGAVAAIPLLDMACAVYHTAGRFGEVGLEPYQRLGGEGR